MKAVDSVRDLISEDNSSLTFFLELKKYITTKALRQKQIGAEKDKEEEKQTTQKKHAKRKFMVPFAKRNEESQIPIENEALSSAKKEGAMDHETLSWECQMVFVMKKS